jgi:hypothetical protein
LHLNWEKPDSSTLKIWSASIVHVFFDRLFQHIQKLEILSLLTLKCILGDKDSEWGVSSWMKIISSQPFFSFIESLFQLNTFKYFKGKLFIISNTRIKKNILQILRFAWWVL